MIQIDKLTEIRHTIDALYADIQSAQVPSQYKVKFTRLFKNVQKGRHHVLEMEFLAVCMDPAQAKAQEEIMNKMINSTYNKYMKGYLPRGRADLNKMAVKA